MPHRNIVAKELADLLSVLAHPNRIRIIEELRAGERDVNSLQTTLGISHASVSQHLMLLRLHRLVSERRQGRRVFYRLRHPEMAIWLTEAMRFLEEEKGAVEQLHEAIEKTRAAWVPDDQAPPQPTPLQPSGDPR